MYFNLLGSKLSTLVKYWRTRETEKEWTPKCIARVHLILVSTNIPTLCHQNSESRALHVPFPHAKNTRTHDKTKYTSRTKTLINPKLLKSRI